MALNTTPADPQSKLNAHNTPDFLNLGAKFTYEVVLDPSAPANRTPSYEQVTDVSTPRHPSACVPENMFMNDGSFDPDLERIAWITDPDSDIVKEGLFAERFNEIVVLDGHERRVRGCEVCIGVFD